MKTFHFQKARLIIVGLAVPAFTAGYVLAQDSSNSTSAVATPPAAVSAPAPQLSYGVPEVLQLSQAKVGDSVIINYIQNSGNNYGLDAAQIIYLRQQGVSDAVINTMLNQRTQSAQIAAAATPSPANAAANSTPASTTTTVQPTVAYVPATTASTVYVIPDTQTYNYNAWLYSRPYYGYYPYYGSYWPSPAISLSFGFGFGNYYGSYPYHGGYYGGWHNNGWHGSSGGGHNNGWHGSSGGGHNGGSHGGGGGWHH
jgi:hypothetical protein